jgi:hypothetical protein
VEPSAILLAVGGELQGNVGEGALELQTEHVDGGVMASEMPAAIRPYSMAVESRSRQSDKNGSRDWSCGSEVTVIAPVGG